MGDIPVPTSEKRVPEPMRYHRELRSYLQSREPEVWEWFTSNTVRVEHTEGVRLDLLKSTYRMERNGHEALYEAAGAVSRQLGLDVPITLYQAQGGSEPNVALAYIPGEVHIVLMGSVLELLNEAEWRSVFGHELGHFLLMELWDGHYMALGELLTALCNDPDADHSYFESARLYALYTEIFCDRVALDATGDLSTSVTSLVKLSTGLSEASADSYLDQAREILKSGRIRTEGLDHPEAFIRVRALQLHAEQYEELDAFISDLIEGEPEFGRLDLLAQRRVSELTRRLIDCLLAEPWMQTDVHVAHARMFFNGYSAPADGFSDETLASEIRIGDKELRDYYVFVILDFVASDRVRLEPALAWGMTISKELGLYDRFCEVAAKELKITKKVMERIAKDRVKLIDVARFEFAVSDEEGE